MAKVGGSEAKLKGDRPLTDPLYCGFEKRANRWGGIAQGVIVVPAGDDHNLAKAERFQ
jgi:hypothetical protein